MSFILLDLIGLFIQSVAGVESFSLGASLPTKSALPEYSSNSGGIVSQKLLLITKGRTWESFPSDDDGWKEDANSIWGGNIIFW